MYILEMGVTAKKAFTLIELLVTIVIIGILSSVAILGFNNYTDYAKKKVTEKNFFTAVSVIEAEVAKCKLSGNRSTALTFNLPCPFQVSAYYQECAAIYMSWKYKIYNPLMPKDEVRWSAGSRAGADRCPTQVEENIRGGVRSGDGQQDGDVNIVICPRSPYCSADPATDGKMKVMWWYDGLKMQDSRIIQLIK